MGEILAAAQSSLGESEAAEKPQGLRDAARSKSSSRR